MDFEHITTEETVATYQAALGIFTGLLQEIRELSKKKPEALMSKGKVKIINRVLEDLKEVMADEPEEKFLDLLDDEDLPQNSDAVLIMVQYEKAVLKFPKRYYRSLKVGISDFGTEERKNFWITEDFVETWEG